MVQGTGWQAWLIRLFTGSPWTHAAICVGDGLIAEAGPDHPVRVVPLQYSGYVLLRHPKLWPQRQAELVQWVRGQVGDRYDWLAVAGIALRRVLGPLGAVLQSRRRYICTELVTEAYAAAGIFLNPKGELMTPVELLQLPVWRAEQPAE